MNWKNRIITAIIAGTALFFLFPPTVETPEKNTTAVKEKYAIVSIGIKTYTVRVADTDEKRTKGLSGSDPLKPDEGMLFVFPENGRHGIWMKEMRYSLDIMWIDENLRIIDARENVSPDTYPDVFTPQYPARFVLEVHGGSMKQNDITIGEPVRIVVPRKE